MERSQLKGEIVIVWLERRTNLPGIRIHQFPTNPSVRAKYAQFVRRHRQDFMVRVAVLGSLIARIAVISGFNT